MAEILDEPTREFVADALIAYNAMETTKRRHFDYLNLLESKKEKFNLAATEVEKDLLATLLTDHDQAVKNFKLQSQTLLASQPDAHQSLFQYISIINDALDAVSPGPAH